MDIVSAHELIGIDFFLQKPHIFSYIFRTRQSILMKLVKEAVPTKNLSPRKKNFEKKLGMKAVVASKNQKFVLIVVVLVLVQFCPKIAINNPGPYRISTHFTELIFNT